MRSLIVALTSIVLFPVLTVLGHKSALVAGVAVLQMLLLLEVCAVCLRSRATDVLCSCACA